MEIRHVVIEVKVPLHPGKQALKFQVYGSGVDKWKAKENALQIMNDLDLVNEAFSTKLVNSWVSTPSRCPI